MKLATILLFVSVFAYGQSDLTLRIDSTIIFDHMKWYPPVNRYMQQNNPHLIWEVYSTGFNGCFIDGEKGSGLNDLVWRQKPEIKLGLYIHSEHCHYDLCEHERLIRDLLKRVEELESKLLTK